MQGKDIETIFAKLDPEFDMWKVRLGKLFRDLIEEREVPGTYGKYYEIGEDPTTGMAPREAWTPEFWEQKGFERGWGDASVRGNPNFEILRKENQTDIEYVILCPTFLRRPVTIYMNKDSKSSWGSY